MYANWRQIALYPEVKALGSQLASTYNVWVGFVSMDGQHVPLHYPVDVRRPVLEKLIVNRSGQFDCPVEPFLSNPTRISPLSEEGFQSLMVPVGVDAPRGYLYCAGWLERSKEVQGKIAFKQRHQTIFDSPLDEQDIDAQLVLVDPSDVVVMESILQTLGRLIERHLEHVSIEQGDRQATSFGGMIGQSQSMLRMFRMVDRVARGSSTALILGENGTGKELVARAIHQRSRRRAQPFVVQNCAAIPADLMESELFGHKRGAFSGAHRDRVGLFESANHGTFFLDEIGEMSMPLQAKLLRVLQEGTFSPVGDSTYRKVDVRIICATNRDLGQMVERGEFRQDLYYRINVIAIQTPPLRERMSDLELLCHFFLTKACAEHGLPQKQLSSQTFALLKQYNWPGNVRQLENEMERLAILSGQQATVEHTLLSTQISGHDHTPFSFEHFSQMTLPEVQSLIERQMITSTLKETNGNKSKAARILGVSRRNLIRKVAQLELDDLPNADD